MTSTSAPPQSVLFSVKTMPRLLIVEGPLKGQSYEITDGATVGRSRSCPVRIEGRHVSRIHCKFEKRGEQFVVSDNDSRNGIFVNGHKVKEKPLAPDDEIEVGEYVIVFEPSNELVAAVNGAAREGSVAGAPPPAPTPKPDAWQAVVQESDQGTSRKDFSRIRAATTVLDSILDPFAEPVEPDRAVRLLDIARAVDGADEDPPALKSLLDGLVDALKATRGFIMLTDERGKLAPAVKRAPPEDDEFYLSNVLFHQVAREKRAVLATDTGKKGASAGKLVTIIAAPMIHKGTVQGFVYLEAPADEGNPPKPRFTNTALRFAAAATAMATAAVATLRRAAKMTKAYDSARRRLESQARFIGEAAPLKQVAEMTVAIAPTDASVLILGEAGTGKSVVARSLHLRSSRVLAPFVAVNCAALSPSLVAGELFGCEKGALPGVAEQKKGLLEAAHGGTIYLLEVGELPQECQAVILRVLEGHSFTRVGGQDKLHVDVRMIASTSHDLEKEMREGKFKQELYWNLATTVMKLTPLRDRRDDIPRLVRHFLELHAGRVVNALEDHVSPEALAQLQAAPWPGNIRELEIAVQLALMAAGPAKIGVEHLRR